MMHIFIVVFDYKMGYSEIQKVFLTEDEANAYTSRQSIVGSYRIIPAKTSETIDLVFK